MRINRIEKFIKEKINNQNAFSNDSVLWISGQPGIGKSQILEQICKKNGWGLSVKYMGTMPLEMVTGLPLMFAKFPKWLAVLIVSLYVGIMNFLKFAPKPVKIPKEGDRKLIKWSQPDILNLKLIIESSHDGAPIILFLDDAHLADKGIQKYMFQLLTYKGIHDYILPDNVIIIMAGNRAGDHAIYNQIAAPITNRLFVIDVEADAEDWIENFAAPYGVDLSVTSFIKLYPEWLVGKPVESTQWASPRSWTYLSNSIVNKTQEELPIEDLMIYADGHIGKEASMEFIKFREVLNKYNGVNIIKGKSKIQWGKINKSDAYAIMIVTSQAFRKNGELLKPFGDMLKTKMLKHHKEILSFGFSYLVTGMENISLENPKYLTDVRSLVSYLGDDFRALMCDAVNPS